jgi:hypothetical protein
MDQVDKIRDPSYYVHPLPDLTQQQAIKLVKSHWPIWNEHLWIGDIDVRLLAFEGVDRFYNMLNNFFNNKDYEFDIETIDVNSSASDVEQVCKAVYLVDAYLQSNSFNDPMCAHYNPRNGKNIVHPGGTRQVILDLFHSGKVKSYYFNTGGFKFNFLKHMQKVDVEQVFLDPEQGIGLVPDHGTLIPHLLRHPGVAALPASMIGVHNQYKATLADPKFKVYSNILFEDIVVPWTTFKPNEASVTLKINRRPDDLFEWKKIKLKAILLILRGVDYKDSDLHLYHKG